MTKLEAAEGVGRKVIYQPRTWQRGMWVNHGLPEEGVIHSMSKGGLLVFVTFGNDPRAKSCRPEDLEFA